MYCTEYIICNNIEPSQVIVSLTPLWNVFTSVLTFYWFDVAFPFNFAMNNIPNVICCCSIMFDHYCHRVLMHIIPVIFVNVPNSTMFWPLKCVTCQVSHEGVEGVGNIACQGETDRAEFLCVWSAVYKIPASWDEVSLRQWTLLSPDCAQVTMSGDIV